MLEVKAQLIRQIEHLTPEQQIRLLDAVMTWAEAPLTAGAAGDELIAHMDDFDFEPDEVDAMMRAIDEECERIDWDGWR